MSKPIVAVIGRPNVGKSTLFNRLTKSKTSIVDDTPGVTRDRIYGEVEWLTHKFTLIDTGGIEPESTDIILSQMRRQAEAAIEAADVIVFLVDVKTGLTDSDMQVANMLRKSHKPVVLVVNKVDDMIKQVMGVYEFYNLGLGDPVPISAGQPLNLGDMLDEIVAHFKVDQEEVEEDDRIKVAIIGKPNVGKSSLVNKIVGEERVIVSDIAGTTRDSVDTDVEINGQRYTLIDTAGLRRKSKIKESIEKYSIIRTVAAIERADIILIMIDAKEGITEQDTKIAGMAHEAGKGCIIVVNKWDDIEKNDKTMNVYLKDITNTLAYMQYAPCQFISAKTGQRLSKLFETIYAIAQNQTMRISTGVLNDVLYEAMAMNQPPSDKGKPLKIFYMTQVSVKPPTFVIFVNDKELMHFSYQRYIENQMREAFGFKGTPLRFIIREKGEKD
ncbi:ribosome biogenesis GTPase Der [Sporanaerobium hydrogeniformans]|uniref:Ribosome biogenesis GTPase Der n=1 Tax=Sporanaerobium hydrogeniformans TaxID=3072179 RepID=A0AC61DE88_9FIRM|nr:ribosome biogenesis GTPase Der [Sporanaerobium hydrogeniformans]